MSLIIKDEETHQLTWELIQLTGETMTGAVTVAMRERLERERLERSVENRLRRLRAIRRLGLRQVSGGVMSSQHDSPLAFPLTPSRE